MESEAIFMFVLFYFMIYCSVFWLIIYYEQRKTVKMNPKPRRFPSVSILIPVWHKNTKQEIKKSLNSVLELDYPNKKIMLVWNGKKDEKLINICKNYEKNNLVEFVITSKKGKAAAINYCLPKINTELVCCLDADSFFARDALKKMVGYFENLEVGAVTTSMKVYNPKNWIQMVQWAEYIFAVYLRRLMSLINSLYVIPGPGGLYRTSVLKQVGGFDEHSLVEDMEIAFKIIKAGYKISNAVTAYVETTAPKSLWELIKQRIRWYTGFCDTLKKYKDFIFNSKYKMLSMFVIPTSFLWVIVLFIALWLLLKNLWKTVYPTVKSYLLVGIDWQIIWKNILRMRLELSYISIFGVIFLIIAVTVLYLGLKLSSEKVNLRDRFKHYFFYVFAYTIMLSIFWIFTVGNIILRKIIPYNNIARW